MTLLMYDHHPPVLFNKKFIFIPNAIKALMSFNRLSKNEVTISPEID